ncbi:EFR1 family ferrodoxin [uncultured Dubosiella sp.]|nr:EFR1 family ferrodoxin [uncultured Dubosiella sp.]
MPTYFQGMPAFVHDFLKKMKLTMDGTDHYVYAVATCGMSDGNFGSQAVNTMKNSGLDLDSRYRKGAIRLPQRKKGIFLPDHFDQDKEEELAKAYEQSRKTVNFTVNDLCVGCGICARQCPAHAIKIKNKRPEWIKEQCILCLGCVHKCPKNAIAYTEDTIGHGQYTNPNIEIIK